ncbi:MAG TPA: family 10 glycosylhydrolase [Casimicrobium sp.]|nr:family 10 glycosylhydrolase [Casimicrobium sp.]
MIHFLPRLMAILLLGLLAACSSQPSKTAVSVSPPPPITGAQPPPAPREFRAMWVATVANIDWPSKPGLSSVQQRAEIKAMVDAARRLNLNAIVLQVRPGADAIYPSLLEPWSEYVSGQQGVAPQPSYDPLAEWISLAHESGIELHAWFNPFRARHSAARSAVASNHISKKMPAVVKTYGDQLWIDPGEADAAAHTLAVIADVVRRYDIDGVHIDDYFYPYPVKAPPPIAAPTTATTTPAPLPPAATTASTTEVPPPDADFPDEPSWQRYRASGGKLARTDWRRDNVNQLVQAMYRAVRAEKAWVKVGISPFGLGRPDLRPAGIKGFSQYDKLYADVELWFAQGWLDYLAPQLYWPIAQEAQAFSPLLNYWIAQNTKARHLWPGLFTSRIDSSEKSWQPEEILQQIALTRSAAGATGHLHFSAVALTQNRKGIADALRASTYTMDALVPASTWLAPKTLAIDPAPRAALRCSAPPNCILALVDSPQKRVDKTALWTQYGDVWDFKVLNGKTQNVLVPATHAGNALQQVVVSSVDRFGIESARLALRPERVGSIALPPAGKSSTP